MEKTIKEWLNELEEPYRTQALEYYDREYQTAPSLSNALARAFLWEVSPEGYTYWDELYSKLRAETNS